MPSLPVVAIVGRPNVGKSTLFNRLIGSRLAIISDVAGTTRDRVYGTAEWNGRTFTVVDTGGLELDPGTHIEERVQDQARVAVEEADLVLFVVDAHAGLAPLDHEVADRLRRAEAPVILVVNKGDNPAREADAVEFYALGMDPTITISAQHGRNTGDLADLIVDNLPPPTEAEAAASVSASDSEETDLTEEEMAELAEVELGAPRVAIVGRPNTGKSTFVNRVLGEERMVVSDVPGTTRDAIDTTIKLDEQEMVLVDTAGIRRRGSIERGIERYSVLRSMKAIDSADVAVVLTDATEGYTAQDAHVVGYVLEAGKGVVLVLNKWDAVEKDEYTADQWLKQLRREAPYLVWADIVFASALTGQRVERILNEALRVAEERYRRVPTGELNRLVMDAVRAHPPSHVRNRLPKIYYATQVGVAPPTFVVFVERPVARALQLPALPREPDPRRLRLPRHAHPAHPPPARVRGGGPPLIHGAQEGARAAQGAVRPLPVVLGGVLGAIGGGLWLLEFAGGGQSRFSTPLWLFPLLFGATVVALTGLDGARTTLARRLRIAAIMVAMVSSLGLLTSEIVATESSFAYAGWLVFVIGLIGLSALVLGFGLAHARRTGVRGIAWLAIVVSLAPLAFAGIGFAYKALTGWWVTDPGLIRIGEVVAALSIGGGWLLLGLGITLHTLISSRA